MAISIFNLNCWLFPPPISSDYKARLFAIIHLIKKRSPDIIFLQEVWSNKSLEYLKNELKNYHSVSSKSLFYNNTGLVVFSKEKPISHKVKFFETTPRYNPIKQLLRKGYIEADIVLNGIKWKIVNTHLYAPTSEKTESITKNQFLELISKIQGTNIILSGDLNLSEKKFEEINQNKFLRLCNSEITTNINNPYSRARSNFFAVRNTSKKTDYILYRSNLTASANCEVIKTPEVSDHYPIFCKVIFE